MLIIEFDVEQVQSTASCIMQSLLLRRTFPSVQRSLPSYSRFLATQPPPSSSSSSSNGKAKTTVTKGTHSPLSDTPNDPLANKSEPVSPSPASLSLDFSPVAEQEEHNEHAQRTGARSSKDSLSSIEKKRRFLSRTMLVAMGVGAIAGVFYLGRDWEDDELREKRMVRLGVSISISPFHEHLCFAEKGGCPNNSRGENERAIYERL